jgi:hypothetical protein
MPMIATLIAVLVWTGPHTACVVARPYDGAPVLSAPKHRVRQVQQFADGGLLYAAPDRQSATVCASRVREQTA